MRRKREKQRPRIVERRLFGPVTCRIGLCGRDGSVRVELPGVRFEYVGGRPTGREIETWTAIWYCELHAKEAAA